jgi:hypothetical protein
MFKKTKLRQRPGVEGKTRDFNEKLHERYDVNAREVTKSRLKNYVIDNPNKYGEDLIITNINLSYIYIEVQVCGTWKENNRFPYLFPFVYARKMKFSNKTLFITYNNNYTEFILFSYNAISKTPSRLKKYDREMVNYVNWSKVIKTNINNLTIEIINKYLGTNYYETETIDEIIETETIKSTELTDKIIET